MSARPGRACRPALHGTHAKPQDVHLMPQSPGAPRRVVGAHRPSPLHRPVSGARRNKLRPHRRSRCARPPAWRMRWPGRPPEPRSNDDVPEPPSPRRPTRRGARRTRERRAGLGPRPPGVRVGRRVPLPPSRPVRAGRSRRRPSRRYAGRGGAQGAGTPRRARRRPWSPCEPGPQPNCACRKATVRPHSSVDAAASYTAGRSSLKKAWSTPG